MAKDWKKRLRDKTIEISNASSRKMNNSIEAAEWIAEKLRPAFNDLKCELKKLDGIASIKIVSHLGGHGEYSRETLEFECQLISLRYYIEAQYSSEEVIGKSEFTVGIDISEPNAIPSILSWGKEEIFNDFLTAFESWKLDPEKPRSRTAGTT